MRSAALAFYFLFAFFPMIIFVSMLIGMLNIPESALMSNITNVIPMEVVEIASDYLNYVTANQSDALMVFGLVFTLYFFSRAANVVVQSVNYAYRSEEGSGFLRHLGVSVIATGSVIIAILVGLILILASSAFVEFLSAHIEFSDVFVESWGILRFVVGAGILFVLLSLIYEISSKERRHMRYILPGAAGAISVWVIASSLFSMYVHSIGRYSLLYGSIGAIMVMLVWLYFTSAIIIMGAELNAVYKIYREKISTIGGKHDA